MTRQDAFHARIPALVAGEAAPRVAPACQMHHAGALIGWTVLGRPAGAALLTIGPCRDRPLIGVPGIPSDRPGAFAGIGAVRPGRVRTGSSPVPEDADHRPAPRGPAGGPPQGARA